jgi:rare lipoprotein A (peptidoglycan hydrolase)
MTRDTLRALAGAVGGSLLIVGLAYAFLVSEPLAGRAEAGERHCPAGTVAASWYGRESGSRTATGARFDGSQWLVAHKSLPFGVKLRLTYRGHSVIVPVGDRGPYIPGRVLDLSERVARVLGTKGAGVACVGMERLS